MESFIKHPKINKDFRYKDNYTLLHLAIEKNNKQAVSLLLNNGFDINAITKDNYSVLDIAVINNRKTLLQTLLLEEKISKESIFKAIHTAISSGNLSSMKTLLKHKSNEMSIDSINEQGTLLHTAIKKGDASIIKKIISDYDFKNFTALDKEKNDSFLTAILSGNLEIVEILTPHYKEIENYNFSVALTAITEKLQTIRKNNPNYRNFISIDDFLKKEFSSIHISSTLSTTSSIQPSTSKKDCSFEISTSYSQQLSKKRKSGKKIYKVIMMILKKIKISLLLLQKKWKNNK